MISFGIQAQLGVPQICGFGFILQGGTCQIFRPRIQDKPKCGKKHKITWDGGTLHRSNVYLKGRHYTYLPDEGNNWGGDTAQHWKNKVG